VYSCIGSGGQLTLVNQYDVFIVLSFCIVRRKGEENWRFEKRVMIELVVGIS